MTTAPKTGDAGRREGAITLPTLRAFVAVSEAGSVSAAAERLGVSQPTISVQLAALERVEVEVTYDGYLKRQEAEAARMGRADAVRVPDELEFREIPGLSREVIEKLEALRPRSVGQASRISGITPAAITILLTHIGLVERRRAEVRSATL
jgi:tRNA uridine 5-carboxymethylaminomethyl modification enzyme